VEKYQSETADNPEIALIQISRGKREGDASRWAKEADLPWLTVLPINVGRSKLMDYRTVDATPFYTLLNTEGAALATGAEEVFSKLAELTKPESE